MKLNIDTNALVKYTNNLEKLSKTAMPRVVKETLNSLAFDVKKNTMPKSAKRFVNREKNFFKANSTVQMAKGSNFSSLKAKVGFMSKDGKSSDDSIENLEKQEHGGTVGGRKYIPVNSARTGKRNKKKVAKRNRLGEIGIGNIILAKNSEGKNDREKFTKAVMVAGKGGFVQSKTRVWRVDKVESSLKTRKLRVKLTGMYIVNDSKTVKIKKATHFMKKATVKTSKKADEFYIKEAEKRFAYELRK